MTMELRTEDVQWDEPQADGSDKVTTEHRMTMRVAVTDSDRWVTRLGVDDVGNFCATELRIEFEDHVIESGGQGQFAPQQLVVWQGRPVATVLGSTGALWATEASWADRMATLAEAHEDWEAYRTESAELRAEWSFVSYALGDHLHSGPDE